MKKNTRKGVFETNSSSTHSLCVSNIKGMMDNSFYPNENGVLVIPGNEFGWEFEKYNDAATKASYLTILLGLSPMLVKILKEQTGATEIISNDKYSAIDHQSTEIQPWMKDPEQVRQFIFNYNSWLCTGNDNTSTEWFWEDGKEPRTINEDRW